MGAILVFALTLVCVGPGAARADLTATGSFFYADRPYDPTGFTGQSVDMPIRRVQVEIVRVSDGAVLATGETEEDGAFSISVLTGAPITAFARVVSRSPSRKVEVQTSPNLPLGYSFRSDDRTGGPTGVMDFGSWAGAAPDVNTAYNILDVLVNGADMLIDLTGSPPVNVLTAYWERSSMDGTYYTPFSNTLHILGEDGDDDAVVGHEQGHYVLRQYSRDDTPGGTHYLGDNDEDLRLAWSEGWATAWMSLVRRAKGLPFPEWYVDTTGLPGAGNLSFGVEIETPSVGAEGAASEFAVAAVLWDIVDGPAEAAPESPDGDPLARPVGDPWSVVRGYMRSAGATATERLSTLEKFWDGWFSPIPSLGDEAAMKGVFGALGIVFTPDAYETDSVLGAPSLVPGDPPERRTFYPAGDVDYATLALTGQVPVLVETQRLFGRCDTRLEILDAGGVTVLASNDNRNDAAPDLSSRIEFVPPSTGSYLARVTRLGSVGRYGMYDLQATAVPPGPVTFAEIGATSGVNAGEFGIGAAWADYDGDGDEDLYVAENANLSGGPSRGHLYRNQGNGVFSDATPPVFRAIHGIGAVWGDFDNDGDEDLFVTPHAFYRNQGGGVFQDVSDSLGVTARPGEYSPAWADVDRDGDLDLFVSSIGGQSTLWGNNGDGTFSDSTANFGLDLAGYPCRVAAFGDEDGDGWPDLFLVGNAAPDRLYRNLGAGRFTDVTAEAGVSGNGAERGALWLDLDADGDLDLFVSAIGTNLCYRNRGDGTFEDVARDVGLADPFTGQGCAAADFDLDGDTDIFVAEFLGISRLFENLGGLFSAHPGVEPRAFARGGAWGDADGDGFPDLYITVQADPQTGQNGQNRLYRGLGGTGHGVGFRLRGTRSNRSAIGARVTVYAGGSARMREWSAGSGWGAMSSNRLFFGIGGAAHADSAVVLWPSGARSVETDLPAGSMTTIVEPKTTDIPGDRDRPRVPHFRFGPAYPNPFRAESGSSALRIPAELTRRGPVRLEVFDVSGRRTRLVFDGELPGGAREFDWDGRDERGRPVASGVYHVRLLASGRHVTIPLVIVR